MASLYAQRSLATAQADLATSVEKLSSGKRINRAQDDAAGLGISEGIAGIRNISNQSIRNLQNASSLVQTADGALDAVGKLLQRALSLSAQKNDAVLSTSQIASIDTEINSLTDEIGRIKSRTTFNGSDSIFGQTYSFGAGPGVTTSFTIPDLSAPELGLAGVVGTAEVTSVSLTQVVPGTVTLPATVTGDGSTLDRVVPGTVTLPATVASNGTTLDRVVPGTVAQLNPALVGTFSKSASVVTSNAFNIANHGFTNGDEVIYSKGSGSVISPLVNNAHYIVQELISWYGLCMHVMAYRWHVKTFSSM
jgi:flagellin